MADPMKCKLNINLKHKYVNIIHEQFINKLDKFSINYQKWLGNYYGFGFTSLSWTPL